MKRDYRGHIKKKGKFVPYWESPPKYEVFGEGKKEERETKAMKRYRETHN